VQIPTGSNWGCFVTINTEDGAKPSYIPSFVWEDPIKGFTENDVERILTPDKREEYVMSRRGVKMTDCYRDVIRKLAEITKHEQMKWLGL
jgi:hypothetical protein